jgi:hypothetical protein
MIIPHAFKFPTFILFGACFLYVSKTSIALIYIELCTYVFDIKRYIEENIFLAGDAYVHMQICRVFEQLSLIVNIDSRGFPV